MNENNDAKSNDLKDIFRQLTAPVVDSVDAKIRDFVAARVEEVVTERLASLEDTVAELRRELEVLQHKKSE
ncbi:unannotated protein [freshwater metagenome]|uniref:Unannotated protein n=1 Tax=freshwater metagenome TaxID=449393 RepID=A0A6J7D7H6_9ZZZZ|nr:hypothetical protein [Actinomycetota bacterium]MUH58035.1 hypothetical protein [Actinomycetota bacterium]